LSPAGLLLLSPTTTGFTAHCDPIRRTLLI
jgi:hypothetical protein